MQETDIDPVRDLLNGFLFLNAKVHLFWSVDEVAHTFLVSKGHNFDVHSYVVEE